MIISIDSEKALGKIQYIFMIKISRELGIKRNISDVIKKNLQRNTIGNIIPNGKIKTALTNYMFPSRLEKKTSMSSLTILIQHCTGSLN